MPDIDITDHATAGADATPVPSATATIDDTSLLAKLGLKQLVSQTKGFFTEFKKPVSQAAFHEFDLDASFHAPTLLAGAATMLADGDTPGLNISPGAIAKLAIKTDGDLFDDNGASPAITIQAGEPWLAFTLGATLNVEAAGAIESVGLKVEAGAGVNFTTYTKVSGDTILKDACTTALRNFGVAVSPAALRDMAVGLVYESEAKGSITTSVTLQQGFDLNAFASVTLPVAKKNFSVQPDVSVGLTGSVELEGDLIVRAYKPNADQLIFGVYTEHASTLALTVSAVAGVEGNIDDTDVFGALLEKGLTVNPNPDNPSGDPRYTVPQDKKDAINKIIQDTLSQSLAVQVAAAVSTKSKYEAAVLFSVDLSSNKTGTDAALAKALHGDWRDLALVAKRLEDIVTRTKEKKLSLSFNFLGLYSASSVSAYLQQCTVSRNGDDSQISIGDTQESSQTDLQVLTAAPDAKQLRKALMLDFLSTVTYAAVDGHVTADMSATHTYLDYGLSMSSEDRYRNVQLGYALGAASGSLDDMFHAETGRQACARARVKYSREQALSFFFSDPVNRTPRDFAYVENLGRKMLARVMVNDGIGSAKRIAFLNNGEAWNQARNEGEGYLSNYATDLGLDKTMLPFFLTDYRTVRFWSNAVISVAPVLADILKMVDGISGDPTQNADFMKLRAKLTKKLGDVGNTLGGALEPTWGEAVMYALAQDQGSVTVDLAWGGQQHSYSSNQ